MRIACHGTSWLVARLQRRCREPTAAAKLWPSSGEMQVRETLRTQSLRGAAPYGTRVALSGQEQPPASLDKQGTPLTPRRGPRAPRVTLVTREELAKQKSGLPPRGGARRRVQSAHGGGVPSTRRWTQAARSSTLWARRQSAPTDLKRMGRWRGWPRRAAWPRSQRSSLLAYSRTPLGPSHSYNRPASLRAAAATRARQTRWSAGGRNRGLEG